MNSCSLKMSYSSFERWHPLSDKPALSVCVPVPKLPGLFWLSVWTHFKIITAGSHLNSEPNWALNVNICNLSHAPDQDLIPVGGQENKQKTTTKTTQQNTTTTKTLQKKPERAIPYDSTSSVQEEDFLLKYWRIKFSCLLDWLPSCRFWVAV